MKNRQYTIGIIMLSSLLGSLKILEIFNFNLNIVDNKIGGISESIK